MNNITDVIIMASKSKKLNQIPKLLPPITQAFILDLVDQSGSFYDANHHNWVLTKEGWITILPGGKHMCVPHILACRDVEQKLIQALVQLARSTFHQHSSKSEITGNTKGINAALERDCKWVIASDDGFWEGPGTIIRSQYMPAKSALIFPGHPEDNGLLSYHPDDGDNCEFHFGLMIFTLPWLISSRVQRVNPRGSSLNFDCP